MTFKAPEVVTKQSIENIAASLEKSFPFLFKKDIFGSYVNQSRIDLALNQLKKEFKGKTVQDIESIVDKKLSDANNKLSKSGKNPKKTSYLKKQLNSLGSYLKKNPIKGPGVLTGSAVVGGTAFYLLYEFIMNTYDTGSPISGVIKTAKDIWGDIKTGYYASKSYPNSPSGLTEYLIDKYGDKGYKINFNLSKSGDIVTITPKSGGESKSFKYVKDTFKEL